jgi:hypothetical protein
MCNSFRFKLLSSTVALAAIALPVLGAPQTARSNRSSMWKEARKPAAKGTRTPVPQPILDELSADPDDCASPTPGETTKLEAYRVRSGGSFLIAVRGRSSCFCGATGNCTFWLYRSRRGKYEMILDADMVNDFGFLKARTNGNRDLVLWSHDSAQRTPARLLQFNGKEYHEVCGWEEDYEFRELPGGKWVSAGDPKIVANECGLKTPPNQSQR